MGFRSTFTTSDYAIQWPDWFVNKYSDTVHFPENNTGALHSFRECKTYGVWANLHTDIQEAIPWDIVGIYKFVIVFLHECDGITRCSITQTAITWSEPETWERTSGVGHLYCYGCSDILG